jgi:hypothetical protein
MTPDLHGAVNQLRLRIEKVLERSFDWVAWQRALESTFVDEYLSRPGSRHTYCVDTSLIIEYLLPRSLQSLDPVEGNAYPRSIRAYPRPRDLALLSLFDPNRPINILPPHYRELKLKIAHWQRRLEIQKIKLDLFQAALDRLIAVIETNGESAHDRERFNNFIEAVLSEENSFSGILALETQGSRSLMSIMGRLRIVAEESLASLVKSQNSTEATGRIDILYKAISRTSKGKDTPFNNRVDAHALYLLERENERLPADHFLILLTQSGKIWSFISNDKQRQDAKFKNKRGKVWLIQTPEVELVSLLVDLLRRDTEEGEAREREVRRELIIDLEQNKRLREIRDEIEHQILPRLERLAEDATQWQESEARVQELEDGLRKLRSVYRDRDRLRTLRLGMDTQESWGGTLFKKLRSLRHADQRELRLALSSELGKLRNRVCDLEQQMLIASPPPPEEDAAFDLLGESSPELHGVVRSQADGTAYFIRFQSSTILGHLQGIESLLGQIESSNSEGSSKEIVDNLHVAMRDAKRESHEEPEYNLMLSAIYASRGLWFEAYVAADQGLRRLGANSTPSLPDIEIEQVRFETQLIKGAALQHWALARYGDLPPFAGQFLSEAAECVRKALAVSVPEGIQGPLGSCEDPRALRELATIFGNAREVENFSRKAGRLQGGEDLISLEEVYFDLAGLPAGKERNLLNLYRAFAEKAYAGIARVPSMRVYFVNTFLFALVEEDGDDYEQRETLASELELLNDQKEHFNFLDTLSCFHYRRALRASMQNKDFSVDLEKAKKYLGRARTKFKNSKSKQHFYKEMLLAREADIRHFEELKGP